MYRIFTFIIIAVLITNCNSSETTTETSEFVGVWIAPAPISEGIFYRPNLIADITPDKMTTYEDVLNPTIFSWKKKGDAIIYENEGGKNRLNIIDNQGNIMKVTLENNDSLQFFRLSANEELFDERQLMNFLESQTIEVMIPKLQWQYRQLVFLPNGQLIKYQPTTDDKTPEFFLANWQILVIRNHYFLFLHNLKDEKPMLIHLEVQSDFKLKGKIAFNNQLEEVEINIIGSEANLATIQKNVEGNWKQPNYTFHSDSTFIGIAQKDTLSGTYEFNSTGDILILEKNNKPLQFGFLKADSSKIDMFYIENFHNEFTLETIVKQ